MKRCHQRKKTSAFTLVELLVGLTIFTMVFAAAFYCLQAGSRLTEAARHHTRAAQILQSEVESIRAQAWASLTSLPSAETKISLASQFDQNVYSKYTLHRTIEGTGDTRKITFTLSWDQRNKTYTRTFVTHYTQGGLYDYIQ
ncbi:MAG: type IV pilus modification PilV family protein [Coraliomargarita sp.]